MLQEQDQMSVQQAIPRTSRTTFDQLSNEIQQDSERGIKNRETLIANSVADSKSSSIEDNFKIKVSSEVYKNGISDRGRTTRGDLLDFRDRVNGELVWTQPFSGRRFRLAAAKLRSENSPDYDNLSIEGIEGEDRWKSSEDHTSHEDFMFHRNTYRFQPSSRDVTPEIITSKQREGAERESSTIFAGRTRTIRWAESYEDDRGLCY